MDSTKFLGVLREGIFEEDLFALAVARVDKIIRLLCASCSAPKLICYWTILSADGRPRGSAKVIAIA